MRIAMNLLSIEHLSKSYSRRQLFDDTSFFLQEEMCIRDSYVPRKAGWDTHGLPVELEVEKLLGLDGKDQIEQYGLVPFIDKCKESVWKYKGMWEKFSDTVGFWADMDNPYITYDDNYIESEWWALKQIWDKNLLDVYKRQVFVKIVGSRNHSVRKAGFIEHLPGFFGQIGEVAAV